MAFSFNFGEAPTTDSVKDSGEEHAGPTERSAKRRRVDPVGVFTIPDDVDAQIANLPPGSQLLATFQAGVTLRGVSSELAQNEIAGFHDEAGLSDGDAGPAPATADGRAVAQAVSENSDLIPQVYEGGMKVWEGAGDLVNCLIQCGDALAGKRVLELGAGAGLPGIYAATVGATVDFQDYNREVIEHLTIPNYRLNVSEGAGAGLGGNAAGVVETDTVVAGTPRFFSGSWAALEEHLAHGEDGTYDVVLTAETLYSLESMPELYSLLKATVNPVGGAAYVASKVYYFGVGGGTQDFLRLVEKDGYFQSSTVMQVDNGVKREVIKLEPAANKNVH
eukprot:m.15417 g.15417  ORF g.15417 m.15417 type:complete len:334 (-) comp4911_c0_seq1:3-1004(-)